MLVKNCVQHQVLPNVQRSEDILEDAAIQQVLDAWNVEK
jgi:hypothetical protein